MTEELASTRTSSRRCDSCRCRRQQQEGVAHRRRHRRRHRQTKQRSLIHHVVCFAIIIASLSVFTSTATALSLSRATNTDRIVIKETIQYHQT